MNIPDNLNECNVITITPMVVECVVVNPTNSTSSDGSASLSITGGTPPYTISWGNGSYGQVIFNLGVGSYPAVVTDFYGDFTANTTCVLTAETTTTTSTTTTTTLKPINDFCVTYIIDGSATQIYMVGNGYDVSGNPTWIGDTQTNCEVTYNENINEWYLSCPVNGGNFYSTDPPTSNPPLNNWLLLGGFPPDSYTFTLGECKVVNTLRLNTTVNQPSCVCDGSITLQATGGNPPYTYSDNNGLTYQGSPVFSNLCPGQYSVSVKDNDGNVVSDSVVLSYDTIPTTYSMELLTTSQNVLNGPDVFETTYLTTLSITPTIPVGVTITFDLQHLGFYNVSRKQSYGSLNRVLVLKKNGVSITTPTPVINNSTISANPQCGLNQFVYVETTTHTWTSISITNGDVITVETDSEITIPLPLSGSCDFAYDDNSFSLSNATISGCDCCDVLIESRPLV